MSEIVLLENEYTVDKQILIFDKANRKKARELDVYNSSNHR